MWLNARFQFIFLEDIVKNDASIKRPFRENKRESNSLFFFNIFMAVFSLSVIGGLFFWGFVSLMGAFTKTADLGFLKILLCLTPHLILLFLFIFSMVLLGVIIHDFVLPIMYKNKVGILKGIGSALSILFKRPGSFILYIFIKIGLGIAAFICAVIVGILLSLVALIVILIGALIYSIVPSGAHLGLIIVFIVIGIPIFLGLMFITEAFLLPIPVFFRTFSLKFLAALDERYDVFALT